MILALFQSFAIATGLQSSPGLVLNPGIFFLASTVVTLTGGALLLMWLGEQITSRGVGNGVSLIVFAGIVAVLPRGVWQMFAMTRPGSLSVLGVLAMAVLAAGVIVTIVRAQRRLLTQYPRRQTGARSFGGEASFLPLKVNTSGVMAPIFASSLLLLPATAMGFLANADLPAWAQWVPGVVGSLQHGQPAFVALYAALIVFFYTTVMLNPEEVAENLRKYGGFLQGIRPGKRTAEYLST